MANEIGESAYIWLGREISESVRKDIEKRIYEAQKALEKAYDEQFERVKDYFFAKYRTDPWYENLTDEYLMEMAEAEAKKWIEGHKHLASLLNTLLNFVTTLGTWIGLAIGVISNDIRRGQRFANTQVPSEIPPIADLLSVYFREIINQEVLNSYMKQHGFSESDTSLIIQANRPLLTKETIAEAWRRGVLSTDKAISILKQYGYTEEDAQTILHTETAKIHLEAARELYLRKLISEEEHDKLLAQLGYTDTQIKYLKNLYYVLPTVTDLIRMAVREVFTPEIAERFGLYSDFPEEFAEHAELLGLSREWALRYWAAHWELPSIGQGYEMLHRGIIDEEDLKTLLRAHDVMPFWRDKLIKLSYAPFTRVDVRRMYREGVIDEKDVFRTYKDLGYDDWHAEKLTEWTIKEALSEDRKLTRGLIEGLYKRGIFTEKDARDALIQIGYREEIADIIIAKAKYDKEKEFKDRVSRAVRTQYLKGLINENEAIEKLSKINMPSTEIEMLIYEWRLEKEARVEVLSAGELKELARKRVIDRDTFIDKMKKLGYSRNDACLLWEATQK